MNITLWECYFTQDEPINDGSASVEYRLLSPNYLTGVPSNHQPRLIRFEHDEDSVLPERVGLPMVIGGKKVRYKFYGRPEYETETLSRHNTWVVQTEVDLIRSIPQEILDAVASVWQSHGLEASYRVMPWSASSVGDWLEILEDDDRQAPARWLAMNEFVAVVNGDTETAAMEIQRMGRDHVSAAAVLVQAIPVNADR